MTKNYNVAFYQKFEQNLYSNLKLLLMSTC